MLGVSFVIKGWKPT